MCKKLFSSPLLLVLFYFIMYVLLCMVMLKSLRVFSHLWFGSFVLNQWMSCHHLHSPFGSVWLHRGKISSEPKCIYKSHVGHWSEITSVKSALLRPFTKDSEHCNNLYEFFLAVGLYGRPPKYQDSNVSCCCSKSTLDLCLCYNKLPVF